MIFQDGEFRRSADSKPMLFDGWDYVPMEPGTAAETQLVAEETLTKRGAPSASAPVEKNQHIVRLSLNPVQG